jgi:hypothetical protein
MEFVEQEGYHFVCFPSDGRRIWVMLDPKTEPYYKQTPKGDYLITRSDFEALEANGHTSLTVLACLESHCSKK